MDLNIVTQAVLFLFLTTLYATRCDGAECPVSHPFPYLNGDYCCLYDVEANIPDSGDVPPCDGSKLELNSRCCKDHAHLQCPHGKGQCLSPNSNAIQIECPLTHPFPFFDGNYCCAHNVEANRPSSGDIPPCDGGILKLNSRCCKDDRLIRCPEGRGKCQVPNQRVCPGGGSDGCLQPQQAEIRAWDNKNGGSPGGAANLQDLPMICPEEGTFLRKFWLKYRRGPMWNDYHMHYEYECCTTPGIFGDCSGTDVKHSAWANYSMRACLQSVGQEIPRMWYESDNDNLNLPLLHGQQATCQGKGFLSYIRLETDPATKRWRYNYDCCRRDEKLKCGLRRTETKSTNSVPYLQMYPWRFRIECPPDRSLLTRVTLFHLRARNFYYEYVCCYVDVDGDVQE